MSEDKKVAESCWVWIQSAALMPIISGPKHSVDRQLQAFRSILSLMYHSLQQHLLKLHSDRFLSQYGGGRLIRAEGFFLTQSGRQDVSADWFTINITLLLSYQTDIYAETRGFKCSVHWDEAVNAHLQKPDNNESEAILVYQI